MSTERLKPHKTLGGVIPPLSTPFEKGEIAPGRLRANIEQLGPAGLSGYLVLGSNGETPLLDEAEKLKLVEAARAAIPQESILMVGAGRESTRETIQFVNRVAGLGAECALVLTPSFYKGAMTPEVLYRHYSAIAEGSTIGILIYIVPQFTGGVIVDSDTVSRLAEHPNIVGLKDSSGHMTRFAEYVANTPDDFSAFVGSAGAFYAALALGAAGGILAIANVVPELCVRMKNLFESGDLASVRRMQAAVIPFARAVTEQHGIAGLKAAMELKGYFGGQPRLPLLPVNEQVRAELKILLEALEGIDA